MYKFIFLFCLSFGVAAYLLADECIHPVVAWAWVALALMVPEDD